jgi:translation elongation factor P/translation initiation factor 5A
LQILSPSINSGFYSVYDINKNYVKVKGNINETLNKKQFSFKIFNKLHEQNISIKKIDKFIIKNNKQEDFINLESKILKITSSNTSEFNIVKILEIQSNGNFLIEDYPDEDSVPLGDGPTSSDNNNITWNILNSNISFNSKISISSESIVDFGSHIISNFKIGDYIFYDENQYPIKKIIDQHKLTIDLNEGDSDGVLVRVYRIIFENCVGQFDYLGISLETEENHEINLEIQNGKNQPNVKLENNKFKENYLILINNQYYNIADIDSNIIKLNGPINDWTLPGTSINYIIYRFDKESISIKDRVLPNIKGHDFDYKDDPPKGLRGYIDRSGSEVVYLNTKTYSTILNSMNNKENINDLLEQNEEISYEIEYKEGLENE